MLLQKLLHACHLHTACQLYLDQITLENKFPTQQDAEEEEQIEMKNEM